MENNYLNNENKIKSGFTIPENYFDDFSNRILEQLPQNKPKVISLYLANKNWVLTVAAMFILALLIPTLSLFNSNSNEFQKIDLEAYIVNYSTITQDDITDLLNESDIENLDIDYNLKNISIENIDLENIDLEQNL